MKDIDIKNRTYYFFDDIINKKKFDADKSKSMKSYSKILLFTTLDT